MGNIVHVGEYQLLVSKGYDEIKDKVVVTVDIWKYNWSEGKFDIHIGEINVELDQELENNIELIRECLKQVVSNLEE